MVCRVADNFALESLRVHLDAPKSCHSQRVDCFHRLPRAETPSYYGIAGAFLGYCQALFHKEPDLTANTARLIALLERAGLPWARSHELFLGHRGGESITQFVESAAAPLRELGRVPILITGLDLARDRTTIDEIFASPLSVVDGETVLCRLTVSDQAGLAAAEEFMLARVRAAEQRPEKMPAWWPLIQVRGDAREWRGMKKRLGAAWPFMNLAINPFVDPGCREEVADQIIVAQIVVPGDDDIDDEGNVRLSEGMAIAGAQPSAVYSIPDFVETLGLCRSWPTSIFLGPTLPHWSDETNVCRVAKAVASFRATTEAVWRRGGHERYTNLFAMAA